MELPIRRHQYIIWVCAHGPGILVSPGASTARDRSTLGFVAHGQKEVGAGRDEMGANRAETRRLVLECTEGKQEQTPASHSVVEPGRPASSSRIRPAAMYSPMVTVASRSRAR
jgi:hypothetical protein